jgi:hypothetical protein
VTEVVITRNFELDLERIEKFQVSAGTAQRIDELVDDLFERTLPLLERFPDAGPPYDRNKLPHAAELVLRRVEARLKARQVRSLVRGDFVLLYIVSKDRVYLVCIKHHREAHFRLGESA